MLNTWRNRPLTNRPATTCRPIWRGSRIRYSATCVRMEVRSPKNPTIRKFDRAPLARWQQPTLRFFRALVAYFRAATENEGMLNPDHPLSELLRRDRRYHR